MEWNNDPGAASLGSDLEQRFARSDSRNHALPPVPEEAVLLCASAKPFLEGDGVCAGGRMPRDQRRQKGHAPASRHRAVGRAFTCDIEGASDQSIRNPRPNDIGRLLEQCPVRQVFTTGRRAFELYASLLGGESICLPSPSAANCAFSLEQLVQRYRAILPYLNEK